MAEILYISAMTKTCTKCGLTKPIEEFRRQIQSQGGRFTQPCLECRRQQSHEYYLAHKSEVVERSRRWALKHPDRIRELQRRSEQKNKHKRKAYYRANKKHIAAKNRRWIEANPERAKEIQRRYQIRHPEASRSKELRHHYGITLAEYDAMMKRQSGRCAICGGMGSIGRRSPLMVDHDHETGNIRQLLCGKCNQAIGLFDEDPARLLTAITYLAAHNRKAAVVS